MMLLVAAAGASIGLVTIGFQSTMTIVWGQGSNAQAISADVEGDVEAGNATRAMMTNRTTYGNMTAVKFLSIQTAKSGSLSQINETAYTLELKNVANNTIQFSDRPERVVETVSTADSIGNWTT
ncbi:MAG TPA: hypothetical protein VE130_11805 [Nitrososphaeraceae archaeon]|jgi:hypothetical protein|nr:hypothetical protein [Nitrososphaeraceae archaeon]